MSCSICGSPKLATCSGCGRNVDWGEVDRMRAELSTTDRALQAFREYMRGANFPATGPDHRIWLAFRAGYRAGSTAAMNTDTAVPDAPTEVRP